jgi:hypothetical protein
MAQNSISDSTALFSIKNNSFFAFEQFCYLLLFYKLAGNGRLHEKLPIGAISCQVTQKLKRAKTLEQPIVSAFFYTACYRLAIFSSYVS